MNQMYLKIEHNPSKDVFYVSYITMYVGFYECMLHFGQKKTLPSVSGWLASDLKKVFSNIKNILLFIDYTVFKSCYLQVHIS